jgi:ParB family transcriptional regulator, chromosome partitioning protein
MARKRLSPALIGAEAVDAGVAAPRITALPLPPIARVAGEAAGEAALRDLALEVRAARDGGRLVQALPLEAIDAGYLVRDRMAIDAAEMAGLVESLRNRGQQVPIEVVELGPGRFGLISGWRRITALAQLQAETGDDRFGRVLALLRRPETAADAYCAMVEENEIRVGLSYYERARIVARSVAQGVFASQQAALAGLFAAASRAKRSKIGSFLKLYEALDDRLGFAPAIPERLGLALARRLEGEPDFAGRLRERLRKGAPADAAAELALLARAAGGRDEAPAAAPAPAAIRLAGEAGRLVLSGPGVTPGFRAALEAWLARRR